MSPLYCFMNKYKHILGSYTKKKKEKKKKKSELY